jgi:hypothetical protein
VSIALMHANPRDSASWRAAFEETHQAWQDAYDGGSAAEGPLAALAPISDAA